MTALNDEKRIAVKLNDGLTNRLDSLAKRSSIIRTDLMLCLVNTWLNVLDKSQFPHIFYVANLLRVYKAQMNMELGVYEHEFSGSRILEKPIPIKIKESDIFIIYGYANKSHLSRHQLLKTMIIVGIEELEKIVPVGLYQYASVEPALSKVLSSIMSNGYKAFKAYNK